MIDIVSVDLTYANRDEPRSVQQVNNEGKPGCKRVSELGTAGKTVFKNILLLKQSLSKIQCRLKYFKQTFSYYSMPYQNTIGFLYVDAVY